MIYPLTPRADRLRVLRARRDQLDALIRRLEDAEIDALVPTSMDDCGTERAYKRHHFYGERACLPCTRAHSAYEKHKAAQRKKVCA